MSSKLKSINLPKEENQKDPSEIDITPIELSDLVIQKCKECGCSITMTANKMGMLPGDSPKNHTGEDQLMLIPVVVCVKCKTEWANA